jgi:uncharacterized protein (TIGR02217 family)
MAFFEHLFPEDISRDAEGGPRFLTSKAYASGGQRITNRDAAYPLHEYSITHPAKTQQEFEALRAFFYVVGGDADAFRFKDWSDFRATASNTTATAVAGAANTWQLCRTYTFGTRQFVRPIYKLTAGSKVLRVRAGVATTLAATPDVNTGRVVITGHQAGDSYVWTGEFHVPVAFKDPSAMWRVLGGPQLMTEWVSIELEEVRL